MISRIALLLASLALSLPALGQTTLNGAGATFPYPMYSKWFSEYNKLHHDIQINYQSIGSGGGIRQVLNGTVDFGASDGPMTDEQLKEAKVKILHIPTVLGADVPAYNIPGVSGELKFTGEALANIFLGKITSWNDPAITKANPGVNLPNQLHLDRLSVEGKQGLGVERGEGHFSEMAGRLGRQRQRRCGRTDPPVAGVDRLHRTDLCGGEQDHLRIGPERGWQLCEGVARRSNRGGSVCKKHARGFSHFYNECAREDGIPHIEFHLAVDSSTGQGSAKGQDHRRFSELDGHGRSEDDGPAQLRAVAPERGRKGQGRNQTGSLRAGRVTVTRGRLNISDLLAILNR